MSHDHDWTDWRTSISGWSVRHCETCQEVQIR